MAAAEEARDMLAEEEVHDAEAFVSSAREDGVASVYLEKSHS